MQVKRETLATEQRCRIVYAETAAWLPVALPLGVEIECEGGLRLVVEQFCRDLSVALARLHPAQLHARAEVADPDKDALTGLAQLNNSSLIDLTHKFIRVECLMEYGVEAAMQADEPDLDVFDEYLPDEGARQLARMLEDTLLLAQLARPGLLRSGVGISYADGRPTNDIAQVSGVPIGAVCDDTLGWPTLTHIPLERVCEWEATLGLFKQGVARTPVQRALASFSHLSALPTGNLGEVLFWSMQGLEAFYCVGANGFRRQLSEKTRRFLGEWDEMKNIVGHLYDFRSKFVHGDFDIERWHNDRELEPQDEKKQDKSYEATMLASRLLLATLQKCAADMTVNVEFD